MILVVLVLTIVGVGIAYFTPMEDRLSGNTRIMRAGVLRGRRGPQAGEMVISAHTYGGFPLDLLLTYGGAVPPLTPPGGGAQAVMLHGTDPEDVGRSRTSSTSPFPSPGGVVDRGTYSLYVRNNQEDRPGSPRWTRTTSSTSSPSARSTLSGGSYTKILEEQLIVGRPASSSAGRRTRTPAERTPPARVGRQRQADGRETRTA